MNEDLEAALERWEKKKGLGTDIPKALNETAERESEFSNDNFNKRTARKARYAEIFKRRSKRDLDRTPLDASIVDRDTRPRTILDFRLRIATGNFPRANEIGPFLKNYGIKQAEFWDLIGYRPYNYRRLTKAEMLLILKQIEQQ